MDDDRSADSTPPPDTEAVHRRLTAEAAALRLRLADASTREKELQADCLLDAGDAGSVTEALAAHLAETDRARGLLTRVEAALARLRAGGYGYCVQCGDAIDGERLQAFPHLERCLPCETRKSKSFE
ncbi:TraR/DksA family transcriptional regulator [Streptomyces sp. NRRL F-5126]|uniref:TraR/DksA family transcriptional regulator n=1 Tax=Streptomyces sp. NRRL F-5126 TaxID=1463857 RepID=UPI00055B8F81|nr:TraR/DksA C4-type zinc finger protein [Streptomyces sp. NRRL F-5126]